MFDQNVQYGTPQTHRYYTNYILNDEITSIYDFLPYPYNRIIDESLRIPPTD
jgi:hypothetical protein